MTLIEDEASLVGRAREAAARAAAYLVGRQSYSAGFCFYKSDHVDEPNLHDTYHAVAALRLLGSSVPRLGELARFLDRARLSAPSHYFYYAFTLELIGCERRIDLRHRAAIRALRVDAPPDEVRGSVTGWLESILRIVRLLRRFAGLPELPHVVRFVRGLCREGGYGAKPNLRDTWLASSILSVLGEPLSSGTPAFIDRLQVPSFGFTYTANSLMGNLDVLHAGVECCALLRRRVRYPTDCLRFALACQTAKGGFSRAPDALPDIELTHRALEIMARLDPRLLARVP